MEEIVKSARRRDTRRSEQARATRGRIIAAALDLFVHQGYAATTLGDIAGQAGVAVQTVYFHFGNKRTVLKEVVDVASVGDDQPVALLDRPWVDQLRAEPDARGVVATWIRHSAAIFGRVAPIMRIVRDAASNDPDMAAQWEINQQQRLTAHRMLAQQLADREALQVGLSVDEAADIIFALVSLELYVLLIGERSWTPAHWECWITDTLSSSVLR